MKQVVKILFGAAAMAGAMALATGGALAQAAVMKECGAEWQTAKDANTTGGKTWNQFLAECRTRKAAAPAAAPAAPAAQPKPAAAAPAAPAPAPAATAPATRRSATAAAAAGAVPAGVVLPRAVDPKHAALSPGKQRLQTCSDQWQANKAAGAGNGDLKWIQKGGGFWSLCNKRLKGEI